MSRVFRVEAGGSYGSAFRPNVVEAEPVDVDVAVEVSVKTAGASRQEARPSSGRPRGGQPDLGEGKAERFNAWSKQREGLMPVTEPGLTRA